jgi:hypothetical protein
MATPGCSLEARFAECTEPTTTSDVFRASSCRNHIFNSIDAFEIIMGPFCCVSVTSEVVASSDEWCDNNAFERLTSASEMVRDLL